MIFVVDFRLVLLFYYVVLLRILSQTSAGWPGPLLGDGKHRSTPCPPIKSSDFRGFDSSRLLILRGGNSHVR